ncbi:MAG: SpoIID/LytB domain-containing protein [Phycisphaerales bacterium]
MSGEPIHPTRRAFIAHASAIAGATLLLAGCDAWQSTRGRGPGVDSKPPPSSSGKPAASPAPPPPVLAAAPAPPTINLVPPTREPLVRVRLVRKPPGESVELSTGAGGGKQWLRIGRPTASGADVAPGSPTPSVPVLLVLASPVRVTADSAGWVLVDGAGQRNVVDGREPIEIGAIKGQTQRIAIDGAIFPGSARLVARPVDVGDDGVAVVASAPSSSSAIYGVPFDVVNVCALEQYVPGVLARELYPGWNQETFHAQAVAARTYALVEMARWTQRRHYDVVAGQASQAYVGQTSHAPSVRAVEQTRGQVLVFNALLVPAYYSSTCGGLSANASDAISDDPINFVPPVRARPPKACCAERAALAAGPPTSPRARRPGARGVGERRPQLRLAALGPIAGIEPIELNQYGRVVRYRVADNKGGVAELSAERLRNAMNYGGGALATPKNPLRSGQFTATIRGGAIQFAGQGYGHGVGMCQYGAEGMARGGATWRTILAEYYPQARIVGAYA